MSSAWTPGVVVVMLTRFYCFSQKNNVELNLPL